MNSILRVLLALWTIGFVVVSCVPLLGRDAPGGGLGLVVGAVLLVPWLIGVIVLVILIWLTNPRTR